MNLQILQPMTDELGLVHDALNCHQYVISGALRRCECGKVQMLHSGKNPSELDWIDCRLYGQQYVDEDLYNVYCSKQGTLDISFDKLSF